MIKKAIDRIGNIIFLIFLVPVLLIIIAFLIDDGFDMSKVGQIGDIIGGITNPLVGIIAIFFSFLAFYMQYQANKQVQDQFKLQQFESQFYELLKLYENIVLTIEYKENKGKKAFEKLYNELKQLENIIATLNIENSINLSYMLFYNGLKAKENVIRELSSYKESIFIDQINKYLEINNNFNDLNLKSNLFNWLYTKKNIRHNDKFISIISKNSILGHYYRHLFHIVEFVVNQDEELLNYKEKRKYIRILRTQMSDIEQTMLFYNWLAGYDGNYFGARWEEREIEKNKEIYIFKTRKKNKNYFFTDYRMIRNVFEEQLFDNYSKKIYQSLSKLKDIKNIEDGREMDNIFEYMDYIK